MGPRASSVRSSSSSTPGMRWKSRYATAYTVMLAITVKAFLHTCTHIHTVVTSVVHLHSATVPVVLVDSPVRSELHPGMLTSHQLWNQGQVRNLNSSPAKLEDDDEWSEVGHTGPLGGDGAAAQTFVENKGEGKQHTQCAWNTHTYTHKLMRESKLTN